MNKLLWLDDWRRPAVFKFEYGLDEYMIEQIVWVKNYYEFVDWIKTNGLPQTIAFDHDLADVSVNEKTGYSAAKWLVEYCLDNKVQLPEWVILSANPIGSKNIDSLLNNFKKHIL